MRTKSLSLAPFLAAFLSGTAVLGAGAAQAQQPVTYYHAGVWSAFSTPPNTSAPLICGIGTTIPPDGRGFALRVPISGNTVDFQADKPTWKIPAGTHIPVVMQIGHAPPWNLTAEGNGAALAWAIDRSASAMFDQQFRQGAMMTISFPDGTELPWLVPLRGSSLIGATLARCVRELTRAAGLAATQPYGASPTQPFAGVPPASAPLSISPAPVSGGPSGDAPAGPSLAQPPTQSSTQPPTQP